jgi:hypothetical protein
MPCRLPTVKCFRERYELRREVRARGARTTTAKDASRLDFSDIPYVVPANDNLRTKARLSARCGNLLRRLIALHGLRWSD